MSFSAEQTNPATGASESERSDLWACLENFRSREKDYFSSWLTLQSSMIPSCVGSLLIMGAPDSTAYSPVASWPEGEGDAERLAEVAEQALAQRCGLLMALADPDASGPAGAGSSGRRHYGAAYPILIDDRLYGVVAVEIAAVREEQLRAVMEQLQWGSASLELFFRRRQIGEDELLRGRLKAAVDLLANVLAEDSYEEACMAFVTGMATQLGCDRVSLGFLQGDRVSLQAISHSAYFDKRMKSNRTVCLAMEEAILQAREIIYPPPPDEEMLITRNHEEMVNQSGAESILTIPLYGAGRYFGAITLEQASDKPFSREDVTFCHSIFALAAPALNDKRNQSRSLPYYVRRSLRTQGGKLLGPKYIERKLIAVLLLAVVLFFSFATGEFRITASSTLEGAVRRTIAAPFRGYIKEANVRAGDTVEEGKVICTLDERDLQLEKSNLQGQQNQLLKQHQEALALRDRAKLNVIDAQLEQVIAQLNLTENKLMRSQIRAPFDGILVSGDLSQKLGSAVEQGENLFEIAPLTDYRLILQVDERDIAGVVKGQKGQLALSSLQDKFNFTVTKITPITTALEGKNCFRVEARLDQTSKKLRPGMEGIGKISVDERKLFSIWTRKLRDWLRIWVWTWWP